MIDWPAFIADAGILLVAIAGYLTWYVKRRNGK
jgi:hypothetical protein